MKEKNESNAELIRLIDLIMSKMEKQPDAEKLLRRLYLAANRIMTRGYC